MGGGGGGRGGKKGGEGWWGRKHGGEGRRRRIVDRSRNRKERGEKIKGCKELTHSVPGSENV